MNDVALSFWSMGIVHYQHYFWTNCDADLYSQASSNHIIKLPTALHLWAAYVSKVIHSLIEH